MRGIDDAWVCLRFYLTAPYEEVMQDLFYRKFLLLSHLAFIYAMTLYLSHGLRRRVQGARSFSLSLKPHAFCLFKIPEALLVGLGFAL